MDRNLSLQFLLVRKELPEELRRVFWWLDERKEEDEEECIKMLKHLNVILKQCYLVIGLQTALLKVKDNVNNVVYCKTLIKKNNPI